MRQVGKQGIHLPASKKVAPTQGISGRHKGGFNPGRIQVFHSSHFPVESHFLHLSESQATQSVESLLLGL